MKFGKTKKFNPGLGITIDGFPSDHPKCGTTWTIYVRVWRWLLWCELGSTAK